MKIAVFSDIHGNCVALDAVLADLERHPAEKVVCLGDAVQGGPQPAQVVGRLRRLACPVVMGNADAWLLSGVETGEEKIPPERRVKMEAVRAWSLSCLSSDDKDFIAAFRPTVELPLKRELRLLCCHGSPTSLDDVILPSTSEADFQKMLGAYAEHVVTGGHTHLQHVRRLGDHFYFNPGSVGLAYRHGQVGPTLRMDPWAEYAVLSVERGRVALEFRRVPFDVGELIGVYRSSGRPHADDSIAQYDHETNRAAT